MASLHLQAGRATCPKGNWIQN